MKRHALITIAFAALFWARAPLCAYACMETGFAGEVAVAEVPSSEHTPCHGTAPAQPESPESGDRNCDCDQIQRVVSKDDVKKAYDPEVSLAPPLAVALLILPDAGRVPPGFWRQHLPPPDVLLLNSTLLL